VPKQYTENIIDSLLQPCLEVRATMLRHTVLYSAIFSSDTRHCHRGSPYTMQCHLEVLTLCYEERTRDVVPSRRHSPHVCAVNVFCGSALDIIAVVFTLCEHNTYSELTFVWGGANMLCGDIRHSLSSARGLPEYLS
jgi:hypothetical protein